jgi:acyl carrier protein
MNQDEIREIVLGTLKGIAPEVEVGELSTGQALRDQVDLDSMDWLNFLIGLHQRLNVDIPESDYRQLTTIDAIIGYLATKLA